MYIFSIYYDSYYGTYLTTKKVSVTFNTSFKNKYYFLTAVCSNNDVNAPTEEEAYDRVDYSNTCSTNARVKYMSPNSFQCVIVDAHDTTQEYHGGIKYLAIGEK